MTDENAVVKGLMDTIATLIEESNNWKARYENERTGRASDIDEIRDLRQYARNLELQNARLQQQITCGIPHEAERMMRE